MLSKSAVHDIKIGIESKAEKWYMQLRDSRFKYLAIYKDRIDSLFKYQKMLHDLYHNPKSKTDKVRIIAQLQSLEMDILNIHKQVPDINTMSEDVSTTTAEATTQLPEPVL